MKNLKKCMIVVVLLTVCSVSADKISKRKMAEKKRRRTQRSSKNIKATTIRDKSFEKQANTSVVVSESLLGENPVVQEDSLSMEDVAKMEEQIKKDDELRKKMSPQEYLAQDIKGNEQYLQEQLFPLDKRQAKQEITLMSLLIGLRSHSPSLDKVAAQNAIYDALYKNFMTLIKESENKNLKQLVADVIEKNWELSAVLTIEELIGLGIYFSGELNEEFDKIIARYKSAEVFEALNKMIKHLVQIMPKATQAIKLYLLLALFDRYGERLTDKQKKDIEDSIDKIINSL